MRNTTIVKRIAVAFSLLLSTLLMGAVPTNQRPFTVKQKDGSRMTLRFIGDENFSYYCTMDDVPLVKKEGGYYYAQTDITGALASTGLLAHEPDNRTQNERDCITHYSEYAKGVIRSVWKERLERRNAQLCSKAEQRKNRRKVFGHPTHLEGQKKGLVILVNYADLPMKATSTQKAWYNQFNEKGYSKNNHVGSVRDYFYDQSYGMLDIDFDVVGPYTLSKGWRYYGKQNYWGSDEHPCELVTEACRLANADVNFKDYDWDGDGEVEQVFVVYAGYSAASGYDEDAIWPHEWHLSYGVGIDGTGAIRLDGVKIDNYALSSELNGNSGSTMDNIGTAVHEFSHCLGLPDFYDVDNKGTQCMDYWDVLDQGCYSGQNWKGEAPTGYTAYERYFSGWLEFEELTTPGKITGLENLGDTPMAYIHYNKGNRNEFIILENRQAKGWFKFPVNAHGLFVYHVDYDTQLWEIDRPNSDPSHPRMTFIPADKSYVKQYTSQMQSDFFPGTNNVRTISNTSHVSCNGRFFNTNSDGTHNMNMKISSIQELGGKISFVYDNYEPKESSIEDIQATPPSYSYDLMGRRTSPTAGKDIYIKNGKKILQKRR